VISERDVAYSVATHKGDLHALPVSALMTKTVISCSPGDSVATVASTMLARNVRHLPVEEGGRLVGMISIRDVLNLRVDEALSREIDRIAKIEGTSASEAARKLLGYGVEVQRQVEASYLRLPYTLDREKTKGRIVIEAQWKPYTPRELWEIEARERQLIDEAEEYGSRA
jgi:hypothetical protein